MAAIQICREKLRRATKLSRSLKIKPASRITGICLILTHPIGQYWYWSIYVVLSILNETMENIVFKAFHSLSHSPSQIFPQNKLEKKKSHSFSFFPIFLGIIVLALPLRSAVRHHQTFKRLESRQPIYPSMAWLWQCLPCSFSLLCSVVWVGFFSSCIGHCCGSS